MLNTIEGNNDVISASLEQEALLKDEPLKNKLLRNGFWLYFFSFIGAPAGYLIKILIAHQLDVAEIGVFYSIIGLIGIISAYNDLGLTEALQYYLPHYFIDKDYKKAKTIIVFTRLVQFISVFVICGGLWFASDHLATVYFKTPIAATLLKWFCLYFLFINLYQVLQSVFIATQKVKIYSGLETSRIWLIVILTASSVWFSQLDIITFTIRWILGLCIATIASVILFWKEFKWLFHVGFERSSKVIKKQWSYGFWVLLGTSAGTLLGQINQQLTLYWFGPTAAAQWAYYLSFITILNVVVGPLIGYLFPLLNELYKKGEDKQIAYLYRLLFGGTIIFGIVGAIVGYFGAEPVAILLYGEKFKEAGTLFRYFSPFIFTVPLSGILFQDIASRGLVKQRVFAITVGLCINVLVSWILSRHIGIEGVVYGQVAGNIILILISLWWWRKK